MKLSPRKESFSLALGRRGEMLGWNYLLKQGYKILEKNYRCKIGEIDVVAEKDKRIIFVEIKTRVDDGFGRPEEAVHEAKQYKMAKVAAFYLKQKRKIDCSCGFAVLAILWRDLGEPQVQLIENAFNLDDTAWQP